MIRKLEQIATGHSLEVARSIAKQALKELRWPT